PPRHRSPPTSRGRTCSVNRSCGIPSAGTGSWTSSPPRPLPRTCRAARPTACVPSWTATNTAGCCCPGGWPAPTATTNCNPRRRLLGEQQGEQCRPTRCRYARGMSRRSLHTTAPDTATLRARLDRAGEAAAAADTDALLVAPGSDLRYLLGQAGGSFERLSTLIVPAGDAAPTLVLPKLEQPGYADVATDELGIDVVTWVDGENPHRIVADRLGRPGRVAVSDTMVALHVLALRDELGAAEQTLAGPILRELRMRKDATEIDALRRAGAAIDRVHARMGEWLRAGRTEAEVGADITAAIEEEGHDS